MTDEYGAVVEILLAGKTEKIGEKPAPVSLRPPRISLETTRGLNPGLNSVKAVSSHLSCGLTRMCQKDQLIFTDRIVSVI
jgi:hypothetical protein